MARNSGVGSPAASVPVPSVRTFYRLIDALCYAFWVGALAVIVFTPIMTLDTRA